MKFSSLFSAMLPNYISSAFVFVFIGSLLAGPAASHNNTPDNHQTTTETEDPIAELFSEYDTYDAPGCAVSVFKDGNSVYFGAFGLANLDYGIPLNSHSVFYMASISKQVTAAAAGLLILRGKIQAEDPVKTYIDDWPEWADDVSVGHLIHHTSGLPDIYGLMDIAGISLSNVLSIDDYYEIIKNGENLKHAPGREYSYTNSGYTVLAKLIQDVSDTPFAEFVDTEILKPLGMHNTHFHDSRHRVIPNRVISYAPGNNSFRQTYLSNFQGVGPGGLYSSHDDWQKWDAFWLNTSEVSGEFAQLQNWMLQPALIDGEPIHYAAGLNIDKWKGMQMIRHGGSFMGFKNDYRRFPEHNLSVLTLCNRQDAEPSVKNKDIARIYLQEVVEEYIRPYAGNYFSEELDVNYTLNTEDGHLVLERRLSPNGPMTQQSNGTWTAGSWEFEFQKDEDGTINGFLLSTGRALDVRFDRAD